MIEGKGYRKVIGSEEMRNPRRRRPLTASTVLAHWRALPQVDADSLKRDLDKVLDSSRL